MDPGNIVYVLALLVGAAIVVVVLLRIMRGRTGERTQPPPAQPVAAAEDEEYLDSSHILPGGTDTAARAAEALRRGRKK